MYNFRLTLAFICVLPSVLLAGDFENGVAALDRKHYDLAIASFDAHIRNNPKDASGRCQRGIAYALKKEYDMAIADFTDAIRLDPKGSLAHYCRGLSQFDRKDFDKAIADYTEAIRLDTKYTDAYLNRGLTYFQKKEYAKTISDYTEVIRLDPKDFLGYNNLAWVLATCPKDDMRDGKRAVELATKACELANWKIADCLATLAVTHAEVGDFAMAIKWQKKALEFPEYEKQYGDSGRKRIKLFEARKPFRDD